MSARSLLTGAAVLTEHGIEPGLDVLTGDGVVLSIGAGPLGPDVERSDLSGLTIVPGYIDIHVHGGGGFSLATTDPEEIRSYARWSARTGVTSFLATVFASDSAEAGVSLAAAALASGPIEGGATLLGINLEGPFINPLRRGALPASWPAVSSTSGFQRLYEAAAGSLRLMTVAPELSGAGSVLEAARRENVRIAVGHTDATTEQALGAFEAGASHITHAFNAMRPFHHREPGVMGAAVMHNTVSVEVIADGAHLHPAVVRLLVQALGVDRVALVTDAVPPAGTEGGVFKIASAEARLRDGRVALPDGSLAGGAATMDQLVRNVVDWRCVDLLGAVRMASGVPAGVAGVAQRKGRIAPGYDADLVALDGGLEVARTWVAGRLVYSRDG